MTFHEDWFGEPSCRAVYRLVQSTHGLHGRVVEVGCWEGRSTSFIAQAAWPETVHAVDTWQGSPGEISADLAGEPGRDVFATFTENMAELTRGNYEAHRMGWRDYFDSDRGPIRFLHIDAEHTYQEVHDNIEAALPLMVAGGIICGDDAHHPPVMEAVNELLSPIRREATLWIWEA